MKRWTIWIILVLGWTVALQLPAEVPRHMPAAEFITTYRIVFAKSLHVAMYAFLTLLAGRLPIASRYRVVLMYFMFAHAIVTELLQVALEPYCHRTGSLGDVGLDLLGMGAGLGCGWKGWCGAETLPADVK